MKPIEQYVVRSKNGWEIEYFDDYWKALGCVEEYERYDTANGTYEPGFYEIYDLKKESVVWP